MRKFAWGPEALADLQNTWWLIYGNDGEDRADQVVTIMETFCLRLAEFPYIGTKHDERHEGLRTTGIKGLAKASVLFLVTQEQVTVVRVSYLGRNIWAGSPA